MKFRVFLSSNFRDMGKVMPVAFGEIKMFLATKKCQLAFSKRQQQLVISGTNISLPGIF